MGRGRAAPGGPGFRREPRARPDTRPDTRPDRLEPLGGESIPLEAGSSDAVISRNIAKLIREGYDRDQAIAIAYKNAGRSNESRHAEGKDPGSPVPGVPLTKLPGIAAFRVGRWNGRTWTPGQLRQMADNFDRLARPGKNGQPWYLPYLSINHDKFPELRGFRFGSLDNVRVERDGTLRADADGVPEPVAKLVKSGMLAHPSVEIVEPMRDTSGRAVSGFADQAGKIIETPVIKCLTFLGNDVPGVKGSEPLPDPVYSSRTPVPVAAFAFVGGVLTRFASFPMDRQSAIAALQALGFDTSMITDDVPDAFVQALLTWIQAKNAGTPPAPTPATPPVSMADNVIPPPVPAPTPAVPDRQPSQVTTVEKFNQQFPGMLSTLVSTANAAMARATAAQGIADRTIQADKTRVIEAFFRDTDLDHTAQVTPAMRPAFRSLLSRLDHSATRKFADATLGKFNGDAGPAGTELEEEVARLKATLPPQAKVGRQTVGAPAGSTVGATVTVGAAGAPATIDPARLARILSGSPQGQAALKKLGAAK